MTSLNLKSWMSVFFFSFATIQCVSVTNPSLNAAQDVYYFGYGSNLGYLMNERLKDGPWTEDGWHKTGELKGPAPIDMGCHILENYQFSYTLDVTAFGDIGSAANVIPSVGAATYGVLYRITGSNLALLDESEDLGKAYDRVAETVKPCALGQGPEVKAWIYVGLPPYVKQGLPPDPEYVDILVKGAKEHNLPETYIEEKLRQSN